MTKMFSVQFLRVVLAAGAVGATTFATGYARAAWVMGAQLQPQRTYFTEVTVVFKVPGPPASGTTTAMFSLWPGLENSQGDLIQTPLGWNDDTVQGWTMHNEVAQLGPGKGRTDPAYTVRPNDTILVDIYLDSNNRGPNCILATGTNCNYQSVWEDLSTNTIVYGQHDWLMVTPPTLAWSAVFEAKGPSYNDCNDLPVGGVAVYSLVAEYASPSNIFSDVPANYTAEFPGSTSQFSNFWMNNNETVFPNCMNIQSSLLNSTESETILYLNSF